MSKGRALQAPTFHKTCSTPRGLFTASTFVRLLPANFQTAAVGVARNALGAWFQVRATRGTQVLDYFCAASPALVSQSQAKLPINWMWRLRQLPPHTKISLLALPDQAHAAFAKAAGSAALFITGSLWGNWSLVLLPSGQARFFSDEATALGAPLGPTFKRYFSLVKAAKRRIKGVRPQVRGTVKNPNDHPHGGRTRAIKYPRTPWGLTAKKSRAPASVVSLRPLLKRRRPLPSPEPLAVDGDLGSADSAQAAPAPQEPLNFYVASWATYAFFKPAAFSRDGGRNEPNFFSD